MGPVRCDAREHLLQCGGEHLPLTRGERINSVAERLLPAGVYPGGAPDTGAQRDEHFYPDFRLNQEIRRCDLHHNNMATSGTMGNAVHIHHNEVYDNAAGLVTDSFYAGGRSAVTRAQP